MRFLKQQVFVSNQDYETHKFTIIIFINLKLFLFVCLFVERVVGVRE
jgi:hypothetical protein